MLLLKLTPMNSTINLKSIKSLKFGSNVIANYYFFKVRFTSKQASYIYSYLQCVENIKIDICNTTSKKNKQYTYFVISTDKPVFIPVLHDAIRFGKASYLRYQADILDGTIEPEPIVYTSEFDALPF